MKIVGYHNTESDNVDDIIANGFVCKKNEKHWLGQGIYFFNDADTAFRNIDMLDHEKDIKTIIAEINIADSQFLNLDDPTKLNEFRHYFNQAYQRMEEEGTRLTIKGKNTKDVLLIYRLSLIHI